MVVSLGVPIFRVFTVWSILLTVQYKHGHDSHDCPPSILQVSTLSQVACPVKANNTPWPKDFMYSFTKALALYAQDTYKNLTCLGLLFYLERHSDNQGPVVQSIIGLTNLLRSQLKCF